MVDNHIQINALPYCKAVKEWLVLRYGKEKAKNIWKRIEEQYNAYLPELPDYGGKKNGHAMAIYGGLLIFSMYPLLPDQPPISELQEFVQKLFMGSFTKLGKIFNLNRSLDMLMSPMIRNSMWQGIILLIVQMQSLRRNIICFMYCLFYAIAISLA